VPMEGSTIGGVWLFEPNSPIEVPPNVNEEWPLRGPAEALPKGGVMSCSLAFP